MLTVDNRAKGIECLTMKAVMLDNWFKGQIQPSGVTKQRTTDSVWFGIANRYCSVAGEGEWSVRAYVTSDETIT